MDISAPDSRLEIDKFANEQLLLGKRDPGAIFKLATFMATRGLSEEAKLYFEKARAECKEEKLVADNAEWLMTYYLNKGDKKTARKIAKHAHKISTAAGIDTLGKYFERTGDLDAALRAYEEEWEHFGSDRLLLAFYLRNMDKDQYWKIRAEEQVIKVFPQGLRKVSIDDFTKPPEMGLLVLSGDAYLPASPLVQDTVIVAINEFEIDSIDQYMLAKELNLNSLISVILWDGMQYLEIKKQAVQSNRLGITLDDNSYRPTSKTPTQPGASAKPQGK